MLWSVVIFALISWLHCSSRTMAPWQFVARLFSSLRLLPPPIVSPCGKIALVTIILALGHMQAGGWPFEILNENVLGAGTRNNMASKDSAVITHEADAHSETYSFPFNTDGKYFMQTCVTKFPLRDASYEIQRQYCEDRADKLFKIWFGMEYFPGLYTSGNNHTADFLATRGTILALLAHKRGYKTYLEIGTHEDAIFGPAQQMFELAVGVDPNTGGTHRMKSDDFFYQNWNSSEPQTFDLIFIDGLHEANQVCADVMNAIMILNEGGTIVMHDCSPHGMLDERAVYPPPANYSLWNGDTWKAVVALRLLNPSELDLVVVEIDHGVGVIQRRPSTNQMSGELSETLTGMSQSAQDGDSPQRIANNIMKTLGIQHLQSLRSELLPLVSVDEMLNWLE
jgi:hypothetical protein